MTPQEQPDSQAGDEVSSNTNNLVEIFTKLITPYVKYPENIEAGDFAEAIAAVLALLPEKWETPERRNYQTNRQIGFNEAIDQTRRNLIGEQHGDSE